jgi:hypothetical protein
MRRPVFDGMRCTLPGIHVLEAQRKRSGIRELGTRAAVDQVL